MPYTPRDAKSPVITKLSQTSDTYSRTGRIVGDTGGGSLPDFLMEKKKEDYDNCGCGIMTDEIIRQREEISMQYRALADMKKMAESYGYDISKPAVDAKEAVQWLYFGYLAAIKTQNGAAMSVGRVGTFLDIYIQRDLENGT